MNCKYKSTGPLISIIVPFYNVDRYIAKCICSILKQSYENLELILVNDASTDNSLGICRKYACKDKRVRIIEQPENRGVDKARFRGLETVKGEYIMFVDSDDYLPLNAVSILYQEIFSSGADIVEGGMCRVLDGWGLIKKKRICEHLEIEQPVLFRDYFISFFGINKLGVNLCGKLYKKTLFDKAKLKPSGMKMGEDLLVNMYLFPFVNKYVVTNHCVYYYRYGGLTSQFNSMLYSDLKKQYYIKMNMLVEYDYQKGVRSTKIEMCNVLCSHLIQMYRFNKSEQEIYLLKRKNGQVFWMK
ncbi:glycosyltransferase family 2 protein [Bacteroides finegoldii]|jgi:glycosyltransferase involved in cell wall biosynthesis|uniref:glycosyltransferase family 2 protein n=1 Tax=Bacteroides finegoldii TaxID=338188 RepID=UPI0022E223B0|nr:glycosyltransferase family 2 protein [Bacteroides finegoldii]